MTLTKNQLLGKIYKTFDGVTLEDGVGLWEASGIDKKLEGTPEYEQLKGRDEREDWQKIPIVDGFDCNRSHYFIDAKGMRFLLPYFLLFDLNIFTDDNDILYGERRFDLVSPDLAPTLEQDLESEWSKNQFRLLTREQMECVVYFLEYKKLTKERYYEKNGEVFMAPLPFIESKKQIEEAIALWKVKAMVQ